MKKLLAFVVMAMAIAIATARVAAAEAAPVAECVDEVFLLSFDGYEAAKRNGHYVVGGDAFTIGDDFQAAEAGDWKYWSPLYYDFGGHPEALKYDLNLFVAYRPRQEVLNLGKALAIPRGFLY